ncbi:anti-sigma factor family protein [Thiovibrio sp. JS02]
MQCTEIQNLFTDYADNSLDRQDLLLLKNHLGECGSCAGAWQEFQQTVQLVQGLEPVNPPADLLPGIHAKLSRQGMLPRLWQLLKKANFSMSIPVAAATFTIAMMAGFLVKNSVVESPQSPPSAQTYAARSGDAPASRSARLVRPERMLAVAHSDRRLYQPSSLTGQINGLRPAPTALATHLDAHRNARRLLSPDLGVLITDTSEHDRLRMVEAMRNHAWQVHQMAPGVLLIHLPPADLGHFQAIMSQYRFAMSPAEAAQPEFGSGKKMLTAAIRFQ